LSDQVSNVVPPTPNYVPQYPYVSESFDAGYMGDDSRNPANPKSPVKNSTGWRFGEPFGDKSEPILCDTKEEGGEVSQHRTRHYGLGERDTNPIVIDLEMEGPVKSHFEIGESCGVKKKKMRGRLIEILRRW
jgi:hypothetical protein